MEKTLKIVFVHLFFRRLDAEKGVGCNVKNVIHSDEKRRLWIGPLEPPLDGGVLRVKHLRHSVLEPPVVTAHVHMFFRNPYEAFQECLLLSPVFIGAYYSASHEQFLLSVRLSVSRNVADFMADYINFC